MDRKTVSRRLRAKLEKDLAASAFAASMRGLAGAQSRFQAGRPLTEAERARLESQGNVSSDWSRMRLGSEAGLETIRGNVFEGDVFLSGFHGEWPVPGGRSWPAGMANCRVRDCVIGNACLYDIRHLERQVIEDGAVLVDVGELDCTAPTTFGLGLAIHPGTESGARTVWLWDALTLDDCSEARSLPPEAQKDFQAGLEALLAPFRGGFGYVGGGAAVLHTRRVLNSWIGPGSLVTGASLIREAALLSAPGEACVVGDDGWIEHALLQPGARVESAGKVSRSILLEHSEVSWGGMVSQSVIGPNTQVSKGEITASLVGPFVGFHHQSLLISAIWLEGRGNIGYGANVGSNHTGKKPDQEIRPGEGNFFGLGCSIKFPANFEDSPYSLFATGVTTLPQRMAFPFSLVTQPLSGIEGPGPGLNEIIPGWMWSDNAYALVRRSYKMLDSDKARRHDFKGRSGGQLADGFFTGRLFAPALARKVLKAFQALKGAPKDRPYYVEEDLPGLGKNFLRGERLPGALSTYEDYMVIFLLRTFAEAPAGPRNLEVKDLVPGMLSALGVSGDFGAHLAGQIDRLGRFKDSLAASLSRDTKRGRPIFDDYAHFHDAPENDGTVARLEEEVRVLLTMLQGIPKGLSGDSG